MAQTAVARSCHPRPTVASTRPPSPGRCFPGCTVSRASRRTTVPSPPPPEPPWGAGYGPYGPYGGMPPPPAPPKRTNRLGLAALLVAVFASSVLGVGVAARLRSGSAASPTVAAPGAIPDAGTSAAGSATSSQAQAVAAKVNPGIV